MKYKVINNGYDFINENNLLNELLKRRGVGNPEKLLNLNEKVILNGMTLKNMQEGIDLLMKHIKSETKIHIIIDCDTDGFTSAAYTYLYLKDIVKIINKNINITYSLHNKKQHGIILEELEGYEFDLLIVPDAGSNDVEQCKNLKSKGKEILILDHHNIEIPNPYAIVINCQDGQYGNNTLSGVGVVHKFFKQMDKELNCNFADQYLNYVAIGMVADDMDLRNLETRYYVLEGLKQINNKKNDENDLIMEIMKKNKIEKLSITDIGWNIAPLLNAVTRVGEMKEKIDTFRALIGEKENREYQPRRKVKTDPKPNIEIQTLQKSMVRELTNIKSRQDRMVKKGVDALKEKITSNNIDKNKIIIIDGTEDLESTFTGLVANKLVSYYKRPAIVLKSRSDNTYGGSGRNYELSELESLQKFLLDLNLFNFVSGHDNAFGFGIKRDKIDELIKVTNSRLKDTKIEDCYFVDYEIPVGRLKDRHIKQVGEWREIWGNTLNEPLFAITDIYMCTDDINIIGDKKNVIKFNKKIGGTDISFIKFYANEEVLNKLICKKSVGINKKVNRVKLDIIGKFKINEWNGKSYGQIEIVDFNSCEAKDFLF